MRYRSQLVVGSPTLRLAAVVAVTALLTIAIAGAVIAAASPQQSPVPVPPVGAPAPTAFTGRIAFGSQVRSGTVESVDGRTESRGSAHAPIIVEVSDPRLDGDATISFDTDEYTGPDGATYSVGTGTWRIENPDGAWQGSYTIVATQDYESVVTTTLAGEGAYAGLTTVWEQTVGSSGWDVRGVIFPAPPPMPPTAP
jgi:hypothetical protein